MPRQRSDAAPGPIDMAGITLTVLFLLCLVLGISRLLDSAVGLQLWPWFLLASAALLAVLLAVESRQAQPMIPPRLFANRQLACA